MITSIKGPESYRSKFRVTYQPPKDFGYASLPVLTFLWGRPWDQVALNYVHSVRPNAIRVIDVDGAVTTDLDLGRVTVSVDKDGLIVHIWQEVQVGLAGGYANSVDLETRGLESFPAVSTEVPT